MNTLSEKRKKRIISKKKHFQRHFVKIKKVLGVYDSDPAEDIEAALKYARKTKNHHTMCDRPCCSNARPYFGDTLKEEINKHVFKEQLKIESIIN